MKPFLKTLKRGIIKGLAIRMRMAQNAYRSPMFHPSGFEPNKNELEKP